MKFHYDLAHGEPVLRDVPVYDAASMANGELIMLGTTDPDSNADQGIAFITAYTGSNVEAIDALGVICEDFSTAADIDNKPVEGSKYLKAIVNPFAVYLCEYSQAAADDVAITTGATDTSITITSLEDDIDGGWLYFPLASGGAAGKLRFITAAASGSCTVDSAITTTTNDTIIKILPANHRLTGLTAASTKLKSTAAAGAGVALHVVENYITSNGHPLEPLRYAKHKGLSGLSGVRIYADLVMLDHVYNNA